MNDEATEDHIPERELLLSQLRERLDLSKRTIYEIRQTLIRLDEIGEPVTRCRHRGSKLAEAWSELSEHVDYDLRQGNGKQTKDQKVRAERHELS